MTLAINLILAVIIAWVVYRWESKLWAAVLLIPGLTVGEVHLINFLQKRMGAPQIRASAEEKTSSIKVALDVQKSFVETISLKLPVLGKISSIVDDNSTADAARMTSYVIGPQRPRSMNWAELLIENVRSPARLEYKILFDRVPGVSVPGVTDRFQLAYVWNHRGDRVSPQPVWIAYGARGEQVEKPDHKFQGGLIFEDVSNEITSSDGVKSLSRAMTRKQKIDQEPLSERHHTNR